MAYINCRGFLSNKRYRRRICFCTVSISFLLLSTSLSWSAPFSEATHILKVKNIGERSGNYLLPVTYSLMEVISVYKGSDTKSGDTVSILQRGGGGNESRYEITHLKPWFPFRKDAIYVVSLMKNGGNFELFPVIQDESIYRIQNGQAYPGDPEMQFSTVESEMEMFKENSVRTDTSFSESELDVSIFQYIRNQPYHTYQIASKAIVVKVESVISEQDATVMRFKHIRTIKGSFNMLNSELKLPSQDELHRFGIEFPKESSRILLFLDANSSLLQVSPLFYEVDHSNRITHFGRTIHLNQLVEGVSE